MIRNTINLPQWLSFRQKQQNRTLEIPECGSVYVEAAKATILKWYHEHLIRQMLLCQCRIWLVFPKCDAKLLLFCLTTKVFITFFRPLPKFVQLHPVWHPFAQRAFPVLLHTVSVLRRHRKVVLYQPCQVQNQTLPHLL